MMNKNQSDTGTDTSPELKRAQIDVETSRMQVESALNHLEEKLELSTHKLQDFMTMLHARHGEQLDAWIQQAKESGDDELQRFAVGLGADHAAVQAGLTLAWSQGQVEGQINRLKLLKRLMYSIANFDLLRQRVLHAA